MEEYRNIENSNELNLSDNSDRIDFKAFDKESEKYESISKLKEIENKKSSEKIKQLTGELFKEEVGDEIDILKKETIPPIEGIEHMQILTESEVLQKIIKSLYEISNQKIKDSKGNELVMENITRDTVNSILGDIINTGKEPIPQIRQYLYKLLSDNTQLYEEILSKIGGPFILGANDRGNRGSSESWGVHMGVDYNLPKGTPVKSIYDGVVVGGKNKNGVFGDQKVIEAFHDIKKDADGGTGNTLIIRHEIGGKIFYSLYVHITDENFSQGQQILKGQEIGKIDGYDTNGHRQPHLHFTIMYNLDNKNILHGYGKSEDLKDMVNPMKVYN